MNAAQIDRERDQALSAGDEGGRGSKRATASSRAVREMRPARGEHLVWSKMLCR